MHPLGGTAENYWWGCAARFFRSWPDFRPKNIIFYTPFQTRTLKSIPVFRPGLYAENMLSFSYLLERKKKLFKSISNSHNSLSFLLIWNWTINTIIHSRSSLENHTQLQTKMGKVYTRFQNKTAHKPHPMGAHTYIAYIRENLPPRRAPCMNCRASSPSEHVLTLSL